MAIPLFEPVKIAALLNVSVAGRFYSLGSPSSKTWGGRIVKQADFLATQPGKFDVVVGNPPYVRHEEIPESQKIQYRRKFSTFRHRSDLRKEQNLIRD